MERSRLDTSEHKGLTSHPHYPALKDPVGVRAGGRDEGTRWQKEGPDQGLMVGTVRR